MTLHELKTWPEPFQALREGRKTYEVRRCRSIHSNAPEVRARGFAGLFSAPIVHQGPKERDYRVGDVLVLREWEPDLNWSPDQAPDGEGEIRTRPGAYTGRLEVRRVCYLTWGLPDGLTVLGLEPVWPHELEEHRRNQVVWGRSPVSVFRDLAHVLEIAGRFATNPTYGEVVERLRKAVEP